MNICGCLIHIAPGQEEPARTAMEATPGVEVHAQGEDSRFVVVVEDTDTALASETIMALHQIPGVVSLTLTFHHFEDLAQTRARPARPVQQKARGQSHDHI